MSNYAWRATTILLKQDVEKNGSLLDTGHNLWYKLLHKDLNFPHVGPTQKGISAVMPIRNTLTNIGTLPDYYVYKLHALFVDS